MNTIKRTFHVIDDAGEHGLLCQLSDGRFACMVCGYPWLYPPMSPIEGDIGPIRGLCRYTVGDVCDDCGTEYGVDIPYRLSAFRKQRTAWLNRVGWSADALRQLRENLGISEEQARGEAEEVRKSQQI